MGFDGCFRCVNTKPGGGAIFRDKHDMWIARCTLSFVASNVIEVETKALEMGLKWIHNKGIENLEIQTNCEDLAKALTDRRCRGRQECKRLQETFGEFSLQKTCTYLP